MRKKFIYMTVCLLLLGFLLLNPVQARMASADGLLLWFHTLLPVLLPFFILSRLLIALDGVSGVTKFIAPLARGFFGLSPNGAFCLLAGFLCGYPVGAKLSADLVREGRISQEEGAYLLTFTNNASPAFLTGYCLIEALGMPELIPVSLFLVYGSPLLYARLTRRDRIFPDLSIEKKTSGSQISFKIVDACIMDGLENILKLGGYLILFSMLAKLLLLLIGSLPLCSCVAVGLLEITNGLSIIAHTSFLTKRAAWVLSLFFVSFGGLSGAAQTESMLLGTPLSVPDYLKAKVCTALLTACLALLYLGLTDLLPALPLPAAP
ncbi:transporter [Faecalicatena orotica]|nr:transporter [Faecalicatena orotica]